MTVPPTPSSLAAAQSGAVPAKACSSVAFGERAARARGDSGLVQMPSAVQFVYEVDGAFAGERPKSGARLVPGLVLQDRRRAGMIILVSSDVRATQRSCVRLRFGGVRGPAWAAAPALFQ